MDRAGELLNQGFSEIRAALDGGAVSSEALTVECLRRANATQGSLNACITIIDEATVLAEARAADARLGRGERHPLLGMPIGIKDLILTQGQRITAGSRMLENFMAPYDATVVDRIKAAGAPIVAKLNLDEFAMGSSNETSYFGAVKNPWDTSRVPGGSSGGSAAAVAARVVPLSLGTDTGGSIRQPSALCGITGLKPTYGRVSRYGVVAFASSLDQVGPMCTDALGAAAVLETIAGGDVHDATSCSDPVPSFLRETEAFQARNGVKGLRLGLPREYLQGGLDAEVEERLVEAIEVYRSLGAEVVEVSLPHTKYALPAYYLICTSEASSNLARYDGVHYGHRSRDGRTVEEVYSLSRAEGFGAEVQMRILLGTFALSSGYYDAYYRKASQVRRLIRRDFEEAFRTCDVIVGPTSPTTAFPLGEKKNDPFAMYLADVYTLSTNLAGLPGLSLNAGFDARGLPVGLQLQAPWWEETRLLGMAAAFEAQVPRRLSPVALELGKAGNP